MICFRKRRYRQTQAKIEMDYRKEDEPPFEEPPQFNSEKRDSPNPDAEGTSTPVSRVSGDQDSGMSQTKVIVQCGSLVSKSVALSLLPQYDNMGSPISQY